MLFERVDRVMGLVRDLDKAKAFFSDLLDITFDPVTTDEEVGIKVVHAGRFGFELGSPIPESTHPVSLGDQGYLAEKGEGMRFLAIKVSSLDEAVAHFKKRGIEPVGFNTVGQGREAMFDPKDTFGIPIVLNEYPDQHPMTEQARIAGKKVS